MDGAKEQQQQPGSEVEEAGVEGEGSGGEGEGDFMIEAISLTVIVPNGHKIPLQVLIAATLFFYSPFLLLADFLTHFFCGTCLPLSSPYPPRRDTERYLSCCP